MTMLRLGSCIATATGIAALAAGEYVIIPALGLTCLACALAAVHLTTQRLLAPTTETATAKPTASPIQWLQSAATACNVASSPDAAIRDLLERVLALTGWKAGTAYYCSTATHQLVNSNIWVVDGDRNLDRLNAASRQFTSGDDLPGIVLDTGAAAWSIDLSATDGTFQRQTAVVSTGIQAAFAIPARLGVDTLAVLEFFADRPAEPSTETLDLLLLAATGISQIIDRERTETAHQDLQTKLLGASRDASMAEIATGVLHNVGNVLNSVNVSAGLITSKLRRSKVHDLRKFADIAVAHSADFGTFVTDNPQGKLVVQCIDEFANLLGSETAGVLNEVLSLTSNVDHIKEIVSMQQDHARIAGSHMPVNVSELVGDALKMGIGNPENFGIEACYELADLPSVTLDKSKVLQVLINLFSNAKHAMLDHDTPTKRLTIATAIESDNRFSVTVADTGVGIDPEKLAQVFQYGYTTWKKGHGFGLHQSAKDAHNLGGELRVTSDGPGTGASFTLELPLAHSAQEVTS